MRRHRGSATFTRKMGSQNPGRALGGPGRALEALGELRKSSGRPWESFGRVWRSSGRALGGSIYKSADPSACERGCVIVDADIENDRHRHRDRCDIKIDIEIESESDRPRHRHRNDLVIVDIDIEIAHVVVEREAPSLPFPQALLGGGVPPPLPGGGSRGWGVQPDASKMSPDTSRCL